jgi:hypothetical protein
MVAAVQKWFAAALPHVSSGVAADFRVRGIAADFRVNRSNP